MPRWPCVFGKRGCVGIDLSVNFNKFSMKNPIMAASGTYGYSIEFDVFCNVQNLGAIVTKGITLEPRAGNEGERIFEVEGGLINRIGLENVGIENFIKQKKRALEINEINYVVNIAGNTREEYFKLAQICEENGIKAIELNVSCPNVEHGCLEFGTDPKTLQELVEGVRTRYNGFLAVKLTPNTSDIEALALAAQNGGADCICAINTLKGLGLEIKFIDGKFSKKEVQGGLSGKCIKPVALSMVKRIKAATSLPIIALGGISKLDDVLEFIALGADAVQIGTENFTTPDICEKLIKDLESFMLQGGFETIDDLKRELRK